MTSPTPAELHARASSVHRAGRFAEAAPLWRELLKLRQDDAESWANLGIALTESRQLDEAEAALRGALQLQPNAPWAIEHLGRLLGFTGRIPEASELYESLLGLAPDNAHLRLQLGYLHLARGDYRRGWPLYEARKDVGDPAMQRLPFPGEWEGEPLAGRKLLIWPEQGFGDQIMAARFAPRLQAAGAEVTLVALAPLTALFASLGVGVVERTGDITLPKPDHWTLPLSIPGILGLGLDDIPGAPYLQAPADRRARWHGKVPQGAIGLAWRGNPKHANDRERSLPSPDILAPLKTLGRPIVDLHQPVEDFADTAALIEQLDLVVTVDTAIAHLAGALGKPVWILLPWYRTDWRWGREAQTTPWYPTARLFRQERLGDWETVIEGLAAEASHFRARHSDRS